MIVYNRSSNQSLLPFIGNNEFISSQYSLFLPIIIGISSLVGTMFSIVDLRRYFLERDLRTHFNYIYHSMLIFCLIHSIIYVPGFYIGVYLSWFIIYPIYCILFEIHGYAIFAGLAYLLMWTSLERHRYLFQINRTLSYSRQIFPLIVVLIFVYICSIFIVILLNRSNAKDLSNVCFIQNFADIILFTLYTFVLPIITMICSTGILMWRLYEHRTRLNKHRRWIRLKRMFYQSIIYLVWYCLSYWPYNIYSLLISYDSNRFNSIILKSTSYLISIYAIQILPILTYFIFESNKKRTQSKYAISNQMDTNIDQQPKWNHFTRCRNRKQPPIVERF